MPKFLSILHEGLIYLIKASQGGLAPFFVFSLHTIIYLILGVRDVLIYSGDFSQKAL